MQPPQGPASDALGAGGASSWLSSAPCPWACSGGQVLAQAAILQLMLDLGGQDGVVVLGPALRAALLGSVGCQGELRPPHRHTDHDFLWR